MSDIQTQRDLRTLRDQLEALRKADTVSYDSGTYIPTYLGGTTPGATTYTTQVGSYVRLGSIVIVTATLQWTAATGTGNAQISLPFAAAASFFSGALNVNAVTFAAGTPQIIVQPSASFFLMQSPATNASSTTIAIESAGIVVFTIVYGVA